MPRPGSLVGPGPTGSRVVTLDDGRATRSSVSGSKAAALATARANGLPVEPGFVLTTSAVSQWASDPAVLTELDRAWRVLSDNGRLPVIVRSSSTIEDTERSSMAGVFRSVLDVRTVDELHAAVDEIITHAAARSDHPFAVLVQPMVEARFGGVLFGADPVTGRTDRIVVAVVRGGPDALVSGAAQGSRYVLSRRGRVLEADGELEEIGRYERRAFVALARRTSTLFDTPQDVEWAIDHAGRVRLLQSRPISTLASSQRGRRHYGTGPVAETFPSRLSTLEVDLWVGPLDEGITQALRTVGAAPRSSRRPRLSRRDAAANPVVFALDGWVVADLTALAPPPSGARRFLDPRVGMRRLRSAWSIGKLRAVLPDRASAALATADEQLAAVPPFAQLSDDDLLTLLDRSRALLRSLHGSEVLCGLALREGGAVTSGAGSALAALERGRAEGLDDEAIIATEPAVLALVPPRIGPPPRLPASRPGAGAGMAARRDDAPPEGWSLATAREQLRLRARWVHELTARAAYELGERLAERGSLPDAETIRDVRFDELARALADGSAPELDPLGLEIGSVPAQFVLDEHGRPVAVTPRRRRAGAADGQGAGGGRAIGVVVDRDDARPGAVLVVPTLDPELAPRMPGLAAIVAETGSVLSHLAILAREYGVATVVGVPDAVRRWPPGVRVEVDGIAGTVRKVEDDAVAELAGRPGAEA